MKLKCNHCNWEWEYTGNRKFYCTCPNCLYKVNIKKNEVNYDRPKEN